MIFEVINTSFFSLGGLVFLKLAFFSNSSLARSYDSLLQQDQKFTLVLRTIFYWISPLTLLVRLKIGALQYLCPEGQGLPVRCEQHHYGQGKRNKQKKMPSPKLCFQSAPFSPLPSDLFKIKIRFTLNELHKITNTI